MQFPWDRSLDIPLVPDPIEPGATQTIWIVKWQTVVQDYPMERYVVHTRRFASEPQALEQVARLRNDIDCEEITLYTHKRVL